MHTVAQARARLNPATVRRVAAAAAWQPPPGVEGESQNEKKEDADRDGKMGRRTEEKRVLLCDNGQKVGPISRC